MSGSGDSETSDSESESDPDVEVTQLVKPVPLRPAQIGIEEINRMLMEARKAAEVRMSKTYSCVDEVSHVYLLWCICGSPR